MSSDALDRDAAATMLRVPVDVLEEWSRTLGFPVDVGGPGDARFHRVEIEALRDALASAFSVPMAIAAAREQAEA